METDQDYIVGERVYPLYEGYNVFDIPVNWQGNPIEQIRRSMTVLTNVTGLSRTRSHVSTPVTRYTVDVTLEGRQAIADFRSWLRTLKGRQVPVWLPTWTRDLEATADIVGTSITVESVGYTGWMFPSSARRHLAIIEHTRDLTPVGVTGASDNGTTETLNISPQIPAPLDPKHSMISFLLLARLSEDSVNMNWFGRELAEATLSFIEVVREAPTP